MGTGFSKKKKQAKMMQNQISVMQEEIKSKEVRGQAGNGLVEVILTGENKIKSLKINPQCVDPEDVEGLEDLIKAAFHDAFQKLEKETSTEIPGLQGLGGLGLGNINLKDFGL